MIKLTILIATVPSRLHTFYPRLMDSINKQISGRDDVEVIGLYDNKKRSVGEKRNSLLSLAQGQFLTFIDDDDRIADDYIQSIISTIDDNSDADCIVFDCETTIDGGDKHFSKYSIHFEYGRTGDQWRGKPAHTMIWRSDIAKKYLYPDKNYGEDADWVVRACADIKKEVRIDKILYYYDFNNTTTETRG